MGNFFSIDSPLARGLSRLTDLFILNIFTIVCSIPIFTIGAAVTALYDALNRLHQDEGRIYSRYFQAFKENFKQSTLIWLILLVTGGLIYLSITFYSQVEFPGVNIILGITALLAVVWCLMTAWVFPLQAKFINTVPRMLHNALLFSVAYLPRSLVMAVVNMIPFLLFFTMPALFLQIAVVWFFIWFSLAAEISLKLLKKPFAKLIGQSASEEDKTEE